MLERKGFWYLLMASVGALWIWAIGAALACCSNSPTFGRLVVAALFLAHCAELPLSWKVGREKGVSPAGVVVKTVIFGFTWWLPLKRGVFDQ